MKSFDNLGLPQNLLDKLSMQGIAEPTPIQYKAIPHALEGRDVLGLAQTGTGKTAAFALPLLTRILKIGGKREEKSVQSLILAPTRELANQIESTIKSFVEGSHLRVRLVVGGVSIAGQIKRLSKGFRPKMYPNNRQNNIQKLVYKPCKKAPEEAYSENPEINR